MSDSKKTAAAVDAASDPFRTSSGVSVRRFYGPGAEGRDGRDTRDPGFEKEGLGRAGEPPYTRGIKSTMYRGRLWTMRQYAGFGTAKETNRRFRWLLEQGQTGLSVAFDLPTQTGVDADHPQAKGEVGRVGVHAGTLADVGALFDKIPLGEVSTSMTINATAPALLAFYLAVAKKQGADPRALRGTLQNDILKEYIARGTYIYPIRHGMRLSVDTMEYCSRNMPKWYPVSISGYHMREAGCSAVQEIAFTFANAEAYVKALVDRGLAVDDFGPRLAFFFGCHSHLLEEVAKFRAARRIWHRIMTEQGAENPRSSQLRFHVQTCGSTLTSLQPTNNVMRVALQALAAVFGGCQSLHTNSYDEALALPSEQSVQIALRTQQILACETGIPETVDPLAGSYAIEALTDELEEKIWDLLKRIRSMGGMLAAIEKRFPQNEIQEAAYRYQKDIEAGRRKVVGVNCYTPAAPPRGAANRGGKAAPTRRGGAKAGGVELLKVSPALESRQKKSLAAYKKKRGKMPAAALRSLAAAAKSEENLVPHILRCAEGAATLGEICGAMKESFGEHNGL